MTRFGSWARAVNDDPASVRRQLMLLTGAISALVAVALVLVVQVILAGASTEVVARVLTDRAEAVVSSADAASTSPELTVPEAVLDPGVAVYDGAGQQVAGSVPPSLRTTFQDLARSTSPQSRTLTDSYTVMALPFTTRGGTAGVVVLAEPLGPYENDEHAALLVSVAAGAVMVLLALVLAAWVGRRALAPVQQMARTAEQWSEHDLDHRFGLGPPTDEIRALGHTLDGLLEKVAQAIRAEQRLTSELAHELRSPLTAVQATAEMISLRDDLDDQLREDVEDIRSACRSMAATMTVLLDIARGQASVTDDESCDAAQLHAELQQRYAQESGLSLDLAPDLVLQVPVDVALRALAPVLDNSLRVARHVVLRTLPAERGVDLTVADDGPGIARTVRDSLFAPGTSSTGSGLGLALARRVARSAGGDVRLVEAGGSGVGATFSVNLPGTITGTHR